MDLRKFIRSRAQIDSGIELIKNKLLFYQPFILSDDIEVGEGMNFCDRYAGVESVFDLNAYAKGIDLGPRKQPPDLQWFRKCNDEYRQIYNYVCEQICTNVRGDLSNLSFAEIGCNTGLNLFHLASRGAKTCYGFDWNDMSPVFAWLNDLLGTSVKFFRGSYCNLTHKFIGATVPEVDVMLNTVFLNHQCDPLQCLSFMCDRAKKGVFLWVLMAHADSETDCALRFGSDPNHQYLNTGRPFPLYFNNEVSITEPLLRLSLRQLGFEDVRSIGKFVPGPKWDNFQSGFRMFFAHRTQQVKSAYADPRS
jgi:hypothetical protein